MATLSPPQSPTGYDYRPRADRVTSFTSTRSHRSSGSQNKIDLTESPKDKRRLAITSKADPRAALNEDQPVAVALQQSNLEDLRGIQHKDGEGNVITDPDKSNPTRHRLERPLDTIRSFNAAAEGTHQRRTSFHQGTPSPGYSQGQYSRRSSYYANGPGPQPQQQQQQPRPGAYYRHSSYGFRPNGYHDEQQAPRPPQHQYQQQYPQQHPQQHPHPQQYQQQGHYGESPPSNHSYQQSYETNTSTSDEYSKSTNPSSQNSSFDHLHQAQYRKPDEPPNQYDSDIRFSPPTINNNLRTPAAASYSNGNHNGMLANRQFGGPPPPPPAHGVRRPVPPGHPNRDAPPPPPPKGNMGRPPAQKRQSWIKRHFSRRDS